MIYCDSKSKSELYDLRIETTLESQVEGCVLRASRVCIRLRNTDPRRHGIHGQARTPGMWYKPPYRAVTPAMKVSPEMTLYTTAPASTSGMPATKTATSFWTVPPSAICAQGRHQISAS